MQTKTEIITSPRLGEAYRQIKHSSGLEMRLYPMQGFNHTYALFATKYGSVDTCFKTGEDADFVKVPEGVAHFLEHKMFENEEGDAFIRYAATGASANAYTSFDRTAYLFSCTENFAQSLEILFDFVSRPYFTDETVEKEQGIIGQEIKMYEDNAEFRAYFNLLDAMYHNNPVRIDIVGTEQSIAQIDKELLYRCYNTFYNLGNMVLCVAGGFDIETVLETADRMLSPAKDITIERAQTDEPKSVRLDYIEQNLPVALPLFHIGFKADPAGERDNVKNQIMDDILLEIIAGDSTPLYRRLYDEGLINSEFSGDAMSSRDYSFAVFGGESRDPARVRDEIAKEITRIKAQGIDPKLFGRYKKASYGSYMGIFGKVESVASFMLSAHFAGVEVYSVTEMIAALTVDDLEARLKVSFDVNRSSMSVVKP
ncbi:MAG: insulinase family protein [Oscillospiraceae bacterium]|nr:insulinase family protein [Oscillospiraceae bacterium]